MIGRRIAIVGIGLRYPDASSPDELWENVLAGRQAFRRLPDERMSHADYWSADPAAPDRFYSTKAAVLRGYEFDRVKFRVAGSTYRSTDMTHWLALDVASAALADAGFLDGAGLPHQSTGVVIGNSLTGEFTRANLMRLRWPYVRRTVAAALAGTGWTETETDAFLRDLEGRYKQPFPPIDEDSLAGGLANTIAGRICNHYDLKGGGFTVDGACSSSLLSVATAARGLVDKDLDVVLAGGVDLSIDPFEVIGFAKTGALATDEMRVYDRASNGFWPGEGCGLVVLMREEDALASGRRIYALVTGWGVSSDGKGGITRPEAAGHRLALARAYQRAGYGVDTVSYFEGHGTGTALGDSTEITALSATRRAAQPAAPPAALSSIKGNIGHTKAAAGVAGLIKAALAVHHQVVPPGTGQHDPHPGLLGDSAALYVPTEAELWPADRQVRAGVSAMGFGGINTHIALEQAAGVDRRTDLDGRTRDLVAGRQDAELLLLDAHHPTELRERLTRLAELLPRLAVAELADVAGALAAERSGGPRRAAVVATSPEQAEAAVRRLLGAIDTLEGSRTELIDPATGVFYGNRSAPPRIAFLFPGQGSGRGAPSALRRRFAAAAEVFDSAGLPSGGDQVATEVAQPRIVVGSLAALRVLGELGIGADTAVGHSLGELTALHWGGAMDAAQLLALATVRGRVMATASRGGGAMAGLAAGPEATARLLGEDDVVIAGYNGPGQTVVSGPVDAVDRVCRRARDAGVAASRISVSHAFHSSMVEPAAVAITERLAEFDFQPLRGHVVSTVTGGPLDPATDLRALLRDQVTRPVRFHQAAATAAAEADLAIEVGPGRVLAGLMAEIAPDTPVLSTDTDSASLAPLLRVVAAAYALGAPVDPAAVFTGRAIRPLPLDAGLSFLASPCESVPESPLGRAHGGPAADAPTGDCDGSAPEAGTDTTLGLLRQLMAERVELPKDAVGPHTHPLDDLHLSSITVGQLVNDVTRRLGRPVLAATTNFATVNLGELARMIDELAETSGEGGSIENSTREVPGVATWVWPLSVEHVPQPAPAAQRPGPAAGAVGDWTVHAPDGHPLAEPLRAALDHAGLGAGVLLCLPTDCGPEHVELFLDAGRAAAAGPPSTRFVVVQDGLGASGLARTLHLEAPRVLTTVVDLVGFADSAGSVDPASASSAVETAVARIVAEVAATDGFAEVRYDTAGTRTVPVLRALPPPAPAVSAPPDLPLGERDVLLVTGGGKGITAECALAVANDTGARLALLGRADPAVDAELAANLSRLDAAGVRYRYERADVTSTEQVRAAVARIQAEFGPVTAVLHGAGRNEPGAIGTLTTAEFRRTLAPKVDGLRTVLAAVDADRIRLLVTFGSIIGRAGLRGEAHYATANDWLTELTVRFGRDHPRTRVLALEWSVWSGAGMGERLGVVEALIRDGITPISVEDGVGVLRRVLADPTAGPVLVISGRTGGLPTLPLPRRELPLRRFVDRIMVHYPDIELVTEADLSTGSDPYLSDHLLDGDLLFPAVMGMEAMTQVATAVTGLPGPPLLERVEFLRPVVVGAEGSTTIRLSALVRGPGIVDVVLRSDQTDFAADHFRARLRLPRPALPDRRPARAVAPGTPALPVVPVVPVDPVTELYGGVLFQGKRFQRLLAYRQTAARRAVAELSTSSPAPWFAPFLPPDLLLANPGTRDAAMHAIQCCVPDATLLPQGVARLFLADPADHDTEYVVLDARERSQDGDSYTYDLDVRDPDGKLVERWEGLTLRAVRRRGGAGPWIPALLGPFLERSLERVLGGARTVVVEPGQATDAAGGQPGRRARTELAASRALGRPARLRYRPDGRPETEGVSVSAAHGAGLTLVVTGSGRLGCDVEIAVDRDEADWAGLLGPAQVAVRDRLLTESDESPAVAGTRVWSALECLRKSGATTQALTVVRVDPDGWALLSSGDATIATWVTSVNGRSDPVVFAVLSGKDR